MKKMKNEEQQDAWILLELIRKVVGDAVLPISIELGEFKIYVSKRLNAE